MTSVPDTARGQRKPRRPPACAQLPAVTSVVDGACGGASAAEGGQPCGAAGEGGGRCPSTRRLSTADPCRPACLLLPLGAGSSQEEMRAHV